MNDAALTALSEEVSALMRTRLSTSGVDPAILRGICKTWCALKSFLKDPDAMKLGELSSNRGDQLEMLRQELRDLIRAAQGGVSLQYASERLPRT